MPPVFFSVQYRALLTYHVRMGFWLMKSEPGVYSIADLARDGVSGWEGVRDYQARNLMRDEMRADDLALIYHSTFRATTPRCPFQPDLPTGALPCPAT